MTNEAIKLLKEHADREDSRMEALHRDIDLIKNNHLHHIEKDLAGIHVEIAGIKTDLSWVKWGIILILGAFVTGGIALIFK